MTDTSTRFTCLSPGARLASIAGAAVCAAGLNLGLLGLFDQASSAPWLNPTPQLLQAQAQCDALASRNAREDCTQALLARAQAPGLRTAQAQR
jgi:hypothetical protein